jgi:hypothetical protein
MLRPWLESPGSTTPSSAALTMTHGSSSNSTKLVAA